MTLEQQVCSLDLAKKLKELGVKQESAFWWTRPRDINDITALLEPSDTPTDWLEKFPLDKWSAFTVAELGEMLPNVVGEDSKGLWIQMRKSNGLGNFKGGHCVEYTNANIEATQAVIPHPKVWDNTEADARAKMLVYLIENNLIPASVEAETNSKEQ